MIPFTLSCLEDKKNLGVSSCKKIPQQFIGMITTSPSFRLTVEEAGSAAAWQAALLADKATRIYYWPNAVNIENVSEEAVREQTSLATMKVRDGRYQFRFMFQENFEMHKSMYSHSNLRGRVFLIDNKKTILGTKFANNTLFGGLNLDLLDVEKLMFNDGTVTTKTPVYISLIDNTEIDVNGGLVDGINFLNELVRLTTANLTVIGTPTATEIIVSVNSSLDNVPVRELDVSDFVLLDASGTAQTITAADDTNSEGIYTLSGTTFETGTLTLVSAANLSQPGFEAAKPVEITIA